VLQHLRTRCQELFDEVGICLHHRQDHPIGQRFRPRPGEDEQAHILDLLFADDTTLLGRLRQREQLEQLAVETLAAWGEKVHTGKLERLLLGHRLIPARRRRLRGKTANVQGQTPEQRLREAHPVPFVDHARFLGCWVSRDGKNQADTDHRIKQATKIWGRMFRQLRRLKLDQKHMGMVLRATVESSLLFGMEARAVHSEDIRSLQKFMNTVVMGATGTRRRDMHDAHLTLQDLRKRLGMDRVGICITWRQMRWLGHVARLPPERLERQVLQAGLLPECTLPRCAQGAPRPTIRGMFWKHVQSLLALTDVPKHEWPTRWWQVAADKPQWEKLMRRWRSAARRDAAQDEWEQRHAPGGPRDLRQQRQAARVESVAGIEVVEGVGQCPHCAHAFPARALLYHVSSCARLTPEQRVLSHRRREQRARRQQAGEHLISDRMQEVQRAVLAQQGSELSAPQPGARRRLRGKQPPPAAYHQLRGDGAGAQGAAAAQGQAAAAAEAHGREARMPPPAELDAATPAVPRAEKRLGSVGDLPAPPRPDGWPSTKCQFCKQQFPTTMKCSLHTKICERMPFDMWLARVRVCAGRNEGATASCPHCGTCFTTAKGASRHAFGCATRRRIFGLPNNTGQWHDTPEDAAQLPQRRGD
jgi:hypothetical protein